ncbi:phytoene desaturase family protein [Sanguibacter sp. HDW7]|uniref:phytoene desaturase family protein n=1 Tax=Sanguibacter sp. HDW7 TaxID=2714931 RepID=UPI00140BA0BE|nr:phytoene desaturase family protein [Sanguibacter sp. HDW7]QIK84234.1 phytoene desaturase [Sanguibacter sp. HDW7]
MSRVVVVGAGVAGLAAATLLAREGDDVEVVDRLDVVGGRAGTWEHAGFTFDLGPSWFLMPEVFESYYAEVGTTTAAQLDLVALDPAYRVLAEDAAPLDVRSGRAAATALFESVEPGAGERLGRYLDEAHDVYRTAVDHLLRTDFGRLRDLFVPALLRRLPTLVRLLVVPLDRHVRSRFADRRLRQILGYPAVFLGTRPERAPSMYHLMSHLDLVDGVRYPRGGFGEVTRSLARLAEEAGVRITLGTEVTAVRTSRGVGRIRTARRPRAHVTGVDVLGPGGPRTIDADVVVHAGDLHHLETQILPAHLRTYPERWWAGRDPGPGAVLVHLGVRGELPQLTHHTLMFTRDWTTGFDAVDGRRPLPDPASIYVCAPSRTDPGVAPAGHETLFVLVPVHADPALGRGGLDGAGDPGVEDIADRAVAQLGAWAGIPDLAERVVVRRTVGPGDMAADLHAWRGGALGPAHTLRQSAMFRARSTSRHVDGLVHAGASTVPGVGVPMCLLSAQVARDTLARAPGRDAGAGAPVHVRRPSSQDGGRR